MRWIMISLYTKNHPVTACSYRTYISTLFELFRLINCKDFNLEHFFDEHQKIQLWLHFNSVKFDRNDSCFRDFLKLVHHFENLIFTLPCQSLHLIEIQNEWFLFKTNLLFVDSMFRVICRLCLIGKKHVDILWTWKFFCFFNTL